MAAVATQRALSVEDTSLRTTRGQTCGIAAESGAAAVSLTLPRVRLGVLLEGRSGPMPVGGAPPAGAAAASLGQMLRLAGSDPGPGAMRGRLPAAFGARALAT